MENIPTAEQLDAEFNPDGDVEHPVITRSMWRQAVRQEETLLGYWQWVEAQLWEQGDDAPAPREIEVCTYCGSPRVLYDANYYPNTGETYPMDNAYCGDCDGDCSTNTVQVGPEFDIGTDFWKKPA